MLDAFRDSGIEAHGRCGLLDEREMHAWLGQYSPDAVFEMNRVAGEIPWFPRSVRHISWVVDFASRDQSQIKGSDITYFFCPDWSTNYETGGFSDWLAPGTNTKHYAPPAAFSPGYDFLFVGHIPAPWSQEELNYVLGRMVGRHYRFSDLLEEYMLRSSAMFSPKTTHSDLKNLCYSIQCERTGEKNLPAKIEYDLIERTKRMDSRRSLIDGVLRCEFDGIRIYGSETWKQWAKYSSYYCGYLRRPADMKQHFASARFCLHDGVGIHFRSMDCMASGGVILYANYKNYETDNTVQIGLHSCFDEGVHYLDFRNQDELRDKHRYYTRCPKALMKIRRAASVAVSGAHTWMHRVRKIIDDYENKL